MRAEHAQIQLKAAWKPHGQGVTLFCEVLFAYCQLLETTEVR